MKKHLATIALAIVPLLSIAQQNPHEEQILAMMKAASIPGLSLASIEDGRIAHVSAYGVRSADTGEAVTNQTVFEAASLSKPVFAYIVLQLMEEKIIDLDRPLYEYMEYEDIKEDERYKLITARLVLSHQPGFPNWRRGDLELIYDPGERFRYSGEGFVYLQKVVEHITGKSLEELASTRVFGPLGMINSSYTWQERFNSNHTLPHTETGSTRTKNQPSSANAAYSLQTTAEDYGKFIVAIMNDQGLKRQTIKQMLTTQVQVVEFGPGPMQLSETVSWGLGVGLQETGKDQEFWHWGDNGNFKCYFTASKDRKAGIVYFTNGNNGLSITPDLVKLFMGTDQPAWVWNRYAHYQSALIAIGKSLHNTDFVTAITPYLDSNGGLDTTKVSERHLNAIGYFLMNAKRFGEAKRAFWMNVEAYPKSSNVYDSYGEAFLRSGDRKSAAEQYSKAAQMDPENELAASVVQQLTEPEDGNTKFVLRSYANAKFVAVVGDFNDWQEFKGIMRWQDGAWVWSMDIESGEYEYKFVVDGVWVLDPANPESKHNGRWHGSILRVE